MITSPGSMIKGLETISLLLIMLANAIFILLVYKWSNYQIMMGCATRDFGSAEFFQLAKCRFVPKGRQLWLPYSTTPLCVCKVEQKNQHRRSCTFLSHTLTLTIPKETAEIFANLLVVSLPSLCILLSLTENFRLSLFSDSVPTNFLTAIFFFIFWLVVRSNDTAHLNHCGSLRIHSWCFLFLLHHRNPDCLSVLFTLILKKYEDSTL